MVKLPEPVQPLLPDKVQVLLSTIDIPADFPERRDDPPQRRKPLD
jgi:hypothetical protein